MREPAVSFGIEFVERVAKERAAKKLEPSPVRFFAPVIVHATSEPEAVEEEVVTPEAPAKPKRGRKSESA